MLVMGVDPGVRGGWAVVRLLQASQPRLEQAGPLPVAVGGRAIDTAALARLWRGCVWPWDEVEVVMEAVGPRPRQGAASAWAFARSLGAVEGVLAGIGVSNWSVTQPAVWKGAFGLPGGRSNKAVSVALARRLTGADLGEHEAEAALIAWHFAKRIAQPGVGERT